MIDCESFNWKIFLIAHIGTILIFASNILIYLYFNLVKAVGDTEMLKKLRRGGDIQGEIEKIENDLKTKRNTLNSTEQKEKKLEGDMKIIDKREVILENRGVLDKALKWKKFTNLRSQVKETRNQKRNLEEEEKQVLEKLNPKKEFLKEYDMKVAEIKSDIEKLEQDLHTVIKITILKSSNKK